MENLIKLHLILSLMEKGLHLLTAAKEFIDVTSKSKSKVKNDLMATIISIDARIAELPKSSYKYKLIEQRDALDILSRRL